MKSIKTPSVLTGCGKIPNIFLALTLLSILLNFKIAGGVWRYRNVLDNEKLFTIQNPIELEYLQEYGGPDFVRWQYPPECVSVDPHSPVSTLRCSSKGFHWVKPLVEPEDMEKGRHIYVSKSPFTFVWYAVVPEDSSSNGMEKIMRIWLIDPNQADSEEIQHTATVPSHQSYYLSRHFHTRGQFPIVTLPSSTNKIYGKFTENGYWEAVLEWHQDYVTVGIDGQPISFQNRLVLDSSNNFYWEPAEGPYDRNVSPLQITEDYPPILVKDPCAPHHAIFLTSEGSFITRDAFRTSTPLMVYTDKFSEPPWGFHEIFNAVLLDDGIILNLPGGVVWRSHETRVLEMNSDLPFLGVEGIAQRTTCLNNHPQQEGVEFGNILIWTWNALYIGGSRITSRRRATGTFLEEIARAKSGLAILTASFASDPNKIAVLMGDFMDGSAILYLYDQLTSSLHRSPFLTGVDQENLPQGIIQMRFFESTKETLLLLDQAALWYSFNDNSQWGTLKLPGFNDLSTAADYSFVHEIVVDQKWNVLIKMENNQMFFCKFGVTELVPLQNWVQPNVPASFYVDQKNQVTLVTLEGGNTVVLRPFPLQSEMLSAMKGSHHDCPYILFQHNMNKYSYYLDKGQEEVLWAELVFAEDMGVNLQVLRSNMALLDFHLSEDLELVHKIFTMNTTIRAKQTKDYTLYDNYDDAMFTSQGIVRVELVPTQLGNRCDLPKNRMSYFSVGCPSNRHLRVAKPWGIDCDLNTFHNYTIPGSILRTPQPDDMTVIYDWQNWGCVFRMHYQSVFKPVLELYDGDKFVKNVDANFVVWESHGRNDYSYNTTMRQVGCHQEAQTWDKMMPLYQNWGPGNYKTCFLLKRGSAGNLNRPYEILNLTSSNHLTFSQEDSAIYIFDVRVVDPNYSFCDLKATFAVQTYGIAKPKYEYLIPHVTLGFTLICLCILGYSYYRYVHIFRELQEKLK